LIVFLIVFLVIILIPAFFLKKTLVFILSLLAWLLGLILLVGYTYITLRGNMEYEALASYIGLGVYVGIMLFYFSKKLGFV